MEDLPTVTPLFLIKSGHENRKTVVSDIIYQNINSNLYQNWFEKKKNKDYGYNFKNKEIWLVT